jgi:eukaryotic-like serine/threonine-protein kinase
MKLRHLYFVILPLILASFALSACAGGAVASSWPGLTVAGETAYVSFNQYVYAIKLSNGSENWRFPAQPIRSAMFFAPPALNEEGKVAVGSFARVLYGLNVSGQQAWEFTDARSSYVAGAVFDKGIIYAPNGDGKLYVLDSNGQLKWKFESKHALWATPVIDSDRIYVAAMDHFIYCLDKANGTVIWQTEDLGGALVDAPTLSPEGTLYVGTFNSEVIAVRSQDGKVLNRFPAGGWVWSSPLLYEGRLFFGDLSGNMFAIDAQTFEQVWKITPETVAKKQIVGSPAVLDGKLYFTSETGNLFIIDPENGAVLSTKTIGGKLLAGPVVAGDLVLVAPNGMAAVLIALDADGNQRWSFVPAKK